MANQREEEEAEAGPQGRRLERRQSIRAIIARYEAEEEAFLRELAQMQAECAEKGEEDAEKRRTGQMDDDMVRGGGGDEQQKEEQEEEESPAMLGTLCTLIGEIAKLRRENGRLKGRLMKKRRQPMTAVESGGGVNVDDGEEEEEGTGRPIGGGGGQQRQPRRSACRAALCALPRRLLPTNSGASSSSTFSCLPLQSSTGASCCSSSAVSGLFSRQQSRTRLSSIGGARLPAMFGSRGGAQEKLSSPPPASHIQKLAASSVSALLSVSAYSADLSSDSSLLFPRRKLLEAVGTPAPRIMANGKAAERHWTGGDYGEPEGGATLMMGSNSRRGMGRRADERKGAGPGGEGVGKNGTQQQQHLRLSSSMTTTASGTSPSAGSSASSSVEPPLDGMGGTALAYSPSKGSFLNLFGLGAAARRHRRQQQEQNGGVGASPFTIGTAFASAVDSMIARRMGGRRRAKGSHSEDKATAAFLAASPNGNVSPPYSPAHSPYTDGYSSGGGGNVQRERAANGTTPRMESEPNLTMSWRRGGGGGSRASAQAGRIAGRRPQSCYFEERQNGGGNGRPTTTTMTTMRGRTKSCKSVTVGGGSGTSSGRHTPAAVRGGNQNEGGDAAELQLEMELLKSRNARLIEQLREKSSRLSMADVRLEKLGRELEQLGRRERFHETMEGHCLRARLAMGIERAFGTLEEALGGQMRAQLQTLKLDAQKQQQMALEAARRDREALQSALEQVERLQHDNFLLLEAKMQQQIERSGERGGHQLSFELMPSFDALYSFAAGLVKKLAQMRQMVAQKCADEFQAELDLLLAQSQLLIAHAQIERQRAQLSLLGGGPGLSPASRRLRRPASFHGECLAERLAHGRLHFFLPFKLHGQRMGQQRRHQQQQGKKGGGGGAFDALVEANEQSIEREFLRLFHSARSLSGLYDAQGGGEHSPFGHHRRMTAVRPEGGQGGEGGRLDIKNNSMASPLLVEARRAGLLQRRTTTRIGGGSGAPAGEGEGAAGLAAALADGCRRRQNERRRRNSLLLLHSSAMAPPASGDANAAGLFKFRRRLSAALLLGTSASSSPPPSGGGTPILRRHNQLVEENNNWWRTTTSNGPTAFGGSPLVRRQHQSPSTITNAASMLRPPTPSAPPISLQSSTFSQSQPNGKSPDRSPSRFGFHLAAAAETTAGRSPSRAGGGAGSCSSSTRRPLTRSGGSGGPELPPIHQPIDGMNPKYAATAGGGGAGTRSASMSRLPKAVAQVGKPPPHSMGMPSGPTGVPPTTTASEQKVQKAVKKAGTSWLNRLRGRTGGGEKKEGRED